MTITLGQITIDSTEPLEQARWWAERFGADIVAENDGWFVVVGGGSLPTGLAFQKVGETTPGKNRIHLDLVTENLETTLAELLAAGATQVDRHTMPTPDGEFAWYVLADPQGTIFCIAQH